MGNQHPTVHRLTRAASRAVSTMQRGVDWSGPYIHPFSSTRLEAIGLSRLQLSKQDLKRGKGKQQPSSARLLSLPLTNVSVPTIGTPVYT